MLNIDMKLLFVGGTITAFLTCVTGITLKNPIHLNLQVLWKLKTNIKTQAILFQLRGTLHAVPDLVARTLHAVPDLVAGTL